MSHFYAYVLLPRQPDDLDDAEAIIGEILAPYNENDHLVEVEDRWTDKNGTEYVDTYERNPDGLWDYWRIGGRWSGCLPAAVGFKAPARWDSCDDGGVDITAKSMLRGDLPAPFTLFGEGYRTKIKWSEYPSHLDQEERRAWRQQIDEQWAAWWGSFYDSLPGDAWLAVVDYHS